MSKSFRGFLIATAFILMSVTMFGLHWLMTGIDKNFGLGVAVGVLLGAGVIGFASKGVREAD
ncbi:hypothetical protein [Mesorhizobium sp. M0909]|uniref:hypothetical protein n=1 Tax=Mesorhizobium sp. M0909 TaxID=2957024 RepID=UPI00333D1C70